MKWIIMGGTFNESHWKPSKIIDSIAQGFESNDFDLEVKNGGNIEEIYRVLNQLKTYNFALWFANIPNSIGDKSIRRVKEYNPHLTLVTSKRNVIDEKEGRSEVYSFQELVRRVLENKANLAVEFRQSDLGNYEAAVFDGLWNVYWISQDMRVVGRILRERVQKLLSFTRVPSNQIGESIPANTEQGFLKRIQKYAQNIPDFVNIETTRFLWNASYRDKENPERMWVSARNTDKKNISPELFVAVRLDDDDSVSYFGERKPSVDTPIQKKIFNHYPNIYYLIHMHIYVENAPYTHERVPCGALEEFDEITTLFPDKNTRSLIVNLAWHGCIVGVSDVELYDTLRFKKRFLPEYL